MHTVQSSQPGCELAAKKLLWEETAQTYLSWEFWSSQYWSGGGGGVDSMLLEWKLDGLWCKQLKSHD